jgi:acyl carrier protein
MDNKQKYNQVFMECFSVAEGAVELLEYNSIPEWDSVGHMGLISEIEDTFEVMLEMDDIVDFSSYKRGIEILAKSDVTI